MKVLERQRVGKSFGGNFIVYLIDDTPTSIAEAFASRMQMIGKKRAIIR